MLISTRGHISKDRIPSEYFQGDPALALCCPLRPGYGLMETVAGNHLITANATSYPESMISSDGAFFDGSTLSLKTTRTVDLSATNKVTVLADIKWLSYPLTADLAVYELSANSSANAGTFRMDNSGSVAGDPTTVWIKGNGGNTYALYTLAVSKFNDRNSHSIAAFHDMSLATNEPSMSVDGYLMTPSSRVNVNNTANFANQTLYLAARAGTSLFSNLYIKNLAIVTRTDIDHADYYAWMNDKATNRFF